MICRLLVRNKFTLKWQSNGFNNNIVYDFAKKRENKFTIIQNPKDVCKLVFEEDGRCRIYEHKNG
jgi:hypothetical protein